jgi:hypothetical protein
VTAITNPNKNGNGNVQGEYSPEVEFEYLDADVWIRKEAQGSQEVAYTEDVLEALEEDSQSDSNGD